MISSICLAMKKKIAAHLLIKKYQDQSSSVQISNIASKQALKSILKFF